MIARLSDLDNDLKMLPSNTRHIVRMCGPNDAIDQALRFISGGETWVEEDDITAVYDYMRGRPVVLEQPPDFIVQAAFSETHDFAVRRADRRATIIFDASSEQRELVWLIRAFNHDLDIDLVTCSPGSGASQVITFFGPDGHYHRAVTDASVEANIASRLRDGAWRPNYACRGEFKMRRPQVSAAICVTGSEVIVANFRAALVGRDVEYAACHIEDFGANSDLMIWLRLPNDVCLAERWSKGWPALDFDTLVTNEDCERVCTRYVAGVVARSAIERVSLTDVEESLRNAGPAARLT